MDYSVKEWKNSSIEVSIKADKELMKKYKNVVFKEIWKHFEMPGFKKWFVPDDVIEENLNIEKFVWLIYREIIFDCIIQIDESWEYSLIWDYYDMDQKKKNWSINIIFKSDVHPKVIVKNDKWKTIKCKKLDVKVTDEELEKTLNAFREEMSDCKNVEKIGERDICVV